MLKLIISSKQHINQSLDQIRKEIYHLIDISKNEFNLGIIFKVCNGLGEKVFFVFKTPNYLFYKCIDNNKLAFNCRICRSLEVA